MNASISEGSRGIPADFDMLETKIGKRNEKKKEKKEG